MQYHLGALMGASAVFGGLALRSWVKVFTLIADSPTVDPTTRAEVREAAVWSASAFAVCALALLLALFGPAIGLGAGY
jgi:hypothetical protein